MFANSTLVSLQARGTHMLNWHCFRLYSTKIVVSLLTSSDWDHRLLEIVMLLFIRA